MRFLALPPQVPRRSNVFWRFVGRAVLRLVGWRVTGELPDLPRFVIAVAPHTSNWDFVIGMATMFAIELRLSFIGKHTLFVGPFAPFMRWAGGVPVDRSSPHGVVAESIAGFQGPGGLVLVVAPEGTRRHVERFKTGFLHIARGAGVPVVLAALDYGDRCVRFGPTIEPGPDVEADRERIEAYFKPIRGKRPR